MVFSHVTDFRPGGRTSKVSTACALFSDGIRLYSAIPLASITSGIRGVVPFESITFRIQSSTEAQLGSSRFGNLLGVLLWH